MSILDWFIEQCQKVFSQNLKSILLLGSVQRGDTTPFSDTDLVIVIGTMNLVQVSQLRSVVRSLEILIDCSIICQDEIPTDPEKFRIGTHGCYQLELVLKHAKCVWGTNILLQFPTSGREALRRSVAEKVIEYTWWTRRLFIESNRDRSLELNYKLNSRIIKLIRDLLYLRHEKDLNDPTEIVVSMFITEYSHLLTNEEKHALADLIYAPNISANTSNLSENYFLIRCSIVNKIHKEVVHLIS
ncbi:MAG TPA: nucleotidyltransferase domain-containing protein [Candidatus Paceibacterota bacterium]|nr:nucleotidyltransferase domain-containing protein [Candidatus Paceibacterota bacterium]